ncbi:MAG: heme ABC exporter ATP-binding protein CcmA [Chloroflexi bacterium]|nr:heme ABC exporter ATP-binding protein CcmA [Chloroflexota bacterium]
MSHNPAADLRLELRGVSKLFGMTVALWQVDVDARAGEFVLLIGANGSGKSTLLRIVAGLTSPTAGAVRWTGAAPAARPRVAHVGHASGLYDELTPFEHLTLSARLARSDPAHAIRLLERIGAASVAGEPCGRLSAGMRRRVALARAFASAPDAILLDEPLAALDEAGVAAVLDLIDEATRAGRLVLAAAPSDARLHVMAARTVALVDGRALRSLPPSTVRTEQIDAG